MHVFARVSGRSTMRKGQGPIKVSPAYTGTAPKKPWFQLLD